MIAVLTQGEQPERPVRIFAVHGSIAVWRWSRVVSKGGGVVEVDTDARWSWFAFHAG
jgi:hypothetical protein